MVNETRGVCNSFSGESECSTHKTRPSKYGIISRNIAQKVCEIYLNNYLSTNFQPVKQWTEQFNKTIENFYNGCIFDVQTTNRVEVSYIVSSLLILSAVPGGCKWHGGVIG